MSKKKTDPELRARLRAWVRYLMESRADIDGYSQKNFADRIEVPASTLNKILNDPASSIGIDVLARIRKHLHQSIDTMIDDDPPVAKAQDTMRPTRQYGSSKRGA